jgi:hypothetical protein
VRVSAALAAGARGAPLRRRVSVLATRGSTGGDAQASLDSSPPGAAADFFERLERNLAGYRDIAGALANGSGEEFATRTFNSELEGQRLAERAGLSSCSPPNRMRPTAYGAFLVDSATDGR